MPAYSMLKKVRPEQLTKSINDLVASAGDTVEIEASLETVSLAPIIQRDNYTDAERDRLYQQIRSMGTTSGFFLVSDHGINDEIIQRAHDATENFFRGTEQAEKDKLVQSPDFADGRLMLRGYDAKESASQWAGRDSEEPIDPVEKFTAGRTDNIWPHQDEDGGEFKKAITEYYEQVQRLSDTLMNVLEHTLGVEEGTLTRALGEGTENGLLRLLHYPEQPRLREVMAGHTDGGTITIISASAAGLEILVDGKWNMIPHISRNVFVVNLGDLFRIWTNNQWKSSIHRVRAVSTDCFRLSLTYFKNQDVEFGTKSHAEESFVQPLPDFRNQQTDIEFGSVNFKGQMKAGMRALRSKAITTKSVSEWLRMYSKWL